MTRRMFVAGTWLATVVGAAALVAASRYSGTGLLSGGGFSVVFAGLGFDVVVYATVGAILTMRRPGNRVGLLLQVAGALIVVTFLGFIGGALLAAEHGVDDTLAGFVALVGALGIYPALILACPALAFVFPDGHLPGPVDRRFDRARYDAERIVATFAERLRAEVDLAEVVGGMRGTVEATVRPMHAAVWLRAGREDRR